MSRYKVNHNFFKEPNNINCYWAGLIAADGNIINNRVRLYLHENDVERIKNFIDMLESNYLIYSSRKLCGIEISSPQMVVDLCNNFHIVPNKSKILEPPLLEKENHIRHFIRGYMDGDGWISIRSKQKSCVGFCGTYNMMKWIKNHVQQYIIGTSNVSITPNGSIFAVRFTGSQCLYILNWLYATTSVHQRLRRKYNLWIKLCQCTRELNQTSRHKNIHFCNRDRRWLLRLKDKVTGKRCTKSFKTETEALNARGDFYD